MRPCLLDGAFDFSKLAGGGGKGGDAMNRSQDGRGLPSSTFQLKIRTFCGIGGAFMGCLGHV